MNNKYNTLNDDVEDNELMIENNHQKASEKVKKNENRYQNNTNNSEKNAIKPPPITFKYVDVTKVRKILSDTHGVNVNTTNIRITEHGIKVQLSDEQQYDTMINHCKKCNDVLFFTHTKKQERKVKFCLYGLWRMPIQELSDELKSLGINAREIEEMKIYDRKYDDQCIYKLIFFCQDKVITSEAK